MTLNGRARDSGANPAPQKPAIQRIPWVDPMQKAGDELKGGFQLIEEAWKKAEAKLAHSHVPIDVRVPAGTSPIGDPENPIGQRSKYLGFFKLKNQWRICYVEEDEIPPSAPPYDDCSSVNVRPITESPVEVRLEMFDFFESLYNKVMEVTKSYVPRIKERVDKFEFSLDMLDV